jgi:carboxylesterase type B
MACTVSHPMSDGATQDVILQIPGRGSLRGIRCGTSTHKFLGVPYALPPVRERRWQKPAPLPDNFIYGIEGGPLDCTAFGPLCPQPAYMMNGTDLSAVEGSEVRDRAVIGLNSDIGY